MRRSLAGARYAIYVAPPRHHPLADFGMQWLGRDAEATGPAWQAARAPSRRLAVRWVLPGVRSEVREAMIADPARYGFHATLRAPFHLRPGRSERSLEHLLRRFAGRLRGFDAPPLRLGVLDGFLALLPVGACPPLRQLAAACIRTVAPLAARPTCDELQRRRQRGLSPRQQVLLDRWGYPFVFDQWRFHFTLSTRLPGTQRRCVMTALAPCLRRTLAVPLRVDSICLFREDRRGQPFRLIRRLPLSANERQADRTDCIAERFIFVTRLGS